MGSINTTLILNLAHLLPNETHTWTWKNPIEDAVYAFSARPTVETGPPYFAKVEISTLKYKNDSNLGIKTGIEFTVKNLTSRKCGYSLYMSWATPI